MECFLKRNQMLIDYTNNTLINYVQIFLQTTT